MERVIRVCHFAVLVLKQDGKNYFFWTGLQIVARLNRKVKKDEQRQKTREKGAPLLGRWRIAGGAREIKKNKTKKRVKEVGIRAISYDGGVDATSKHLILIS
jgi:hypothetical protein